ncbi:MAG: DsbC family protein [Pseudomonadota bacterium]|nr:DsbC family protein [Pseudomonadota bacterium]
MKIIAALAAAAVSFILAVPAAAQDADKVRAELKKRVPEAPVDSVRKIPYGALYEVTMGSEIFYTDDKASFLVLGSIVDLRTKENITEARIRQVNRVNFADLPLDSAIKIVRGNGSRKVAIFEDPNCGYCKRFERDLSAVNDITVYVFLYPILSEASMQKSKTVWCAPDRAKAWLDVMVRDTPVPNDGSCATPIDKILAFGQSKRIQGTPTLIFEDGERVPGVMAIADLEKKLSAAKNPAPRAAAQ